MESNCLRNWKTVAQILEWIVGSERKALLREREAYFIKLVGFKSNMIGFFKRTSLRRKMSRTVLSGTSDGGKTVFFHTAVEPSGGIRNLICVGQNG